MKEEEAESIFSILKILTEIPIIQSILLLYLVFNMEEFIQIIDSASRKKLRRSLWKVSTVTPSSDIIRLRPEDWN